MRCSAGLGFELPTRWRCPRFPLFFTVRARILHPNLLIKVRGDLNSQLSGDVTRKPLFYMMISCTRNSRKENRKLSFS